MDRGKKLILAGILALTVAIALLPTLYVLARDARHDEEYVWALANRVTGDTALLFSLAWHFVDRQVANAIEDIEEAFYETDRNAGDWSRLFAAQIENQSLFHDILLVEPDGFVLASGRIDSPLRISGLMAASGEPSAHTSRLPAYGEHPYENYVLPYLVGLQRDGNGRFRYALVAFVNSDLFELTADEVLSDDKMDLCVLDRTGRIVFRHPQPQPFHRREKGQRIPLSEWETLKSTTGPGNRTVVMADEATYFSGYTHLLDESGDRFGTVIASLNERDAAQYVGEGRRDRVRLSVLTLVFAFAALLVGYALTRRLLPDAVPVRRGFVVPFESALAARESAEPDETGNERRKIFGRDFLTGALNRRRGLAELEALCRESAGSGRVFSIVFADIDDFKSINERYGTKVGDVVLREIGRAIRDTLSAKDGICRYGGDEFLLILPDMNEEAAQERWSEVEARIASLKFPEIPDKKITLSCGIAQFSPSCPTTESELIRAAKDALVRRG